MIGLNILFDKLSETENKLFKELLNAQKREDLKNEEDFRAEIDRYATALKTLSVCLKKYHNKKVIILLDEYDVPLENAYYKGFYNEMVDFIRSLFESALKTNDALERAVVTGCLRISSELEKAISRENYQRIRKDMDKQRKQLHDTKQLLRTVSMLAETGTKEELLSFIAQTSERLSVSDDRLCADTFLDSILRYYAASAREHNIPFSVEVRCDDLPFQETDITILLGNILENAIRSSEEWRNDHEGNRGIICKINVMQNLLGIYIENPCSMVKYAFRPESTCLPDGYLPAGAFLSTTGGGQGLMRIDSIARKYEGSAAFYYDDKAQTYYTRVVLMMPE